MLGELDRIRERGGRTVVIDPVRTGTAKVADEWVPIVPGTDALLLLAIVHVIFADDLVDLGDLADIVNGLDDLRDLSRPFSPERVAPVCAVPATTIRRLAHEISAAKAAAVYGRIGLCTQEFGTLASWLTDVVAIITGNFDRAGTLMFSKPVAPYMDLMPSKTGTFGTWHSRVRGAPEVLGEVPASCLAEEIDTPGEGQIKGLINIASNPVVTAPDSARLDQALDMLECMISVDAYLNQNTRHSHVVLPATSALEQPYFDIWSWVFALRSGSKYYDPLFESPAGWVPEWQVMLRLGALCAGRRNDEIDIEELDDDFFAVLCAGAGLDPATVRAQAPEPGPVRICDLSVRAGPWGDRYGENPGGLTLEAMREAPNGIDLGLAEPRLREILRTGSGRIELAPEYIAADIPRLETLFERPRPEIVLVSRRHVRSLNSWMHNVEVLMKGKDRSGLRIHPDDAGRAGVVEGGLATVTSSAGSVVVTVEEVTDDMSPGVVSLPHGWGHDVDGARLAVARRYPGVTNNLLSPAEFLDVPSGNAALNGIPVTVEQGPVHHEVSVRRGDHPIDAVEEPGEPELYGNAGFAG